MTCVVMGEVTHKPMSVMTLSQVAPGVVNIMAPLTPRCRMCSKPMVGESLGRRCPACVESRRRHRAARKATRKERYAAHARHARRRLKREMVTAYGGACACCGETTIAFLSLEHLNGRTERDNLKGVEMYRYARRHGWPDVYTCLCMNCNLAKAINGGVCPHQSLNHN